MPNYNDAQGVADLLSQFDFNIISEGPGDFSTQHRKYTCEFSKPGIESFTTTYQSNPDVHGQPTATDVFAALASDALAVDGRHIDDFADEMGFEKPSQAIRAYESCRKTLDWLKNDMQLMTSEISDIAETLDNELDEVKEEVERVQAERKAKHEFEHPPVPEGFTSIEDLQASLNLGEYGDRITDYTGNIGDAFSEIAEFTSSAIMSAEVAPGAASATVHDVAGVPYEVPADVLNGLKDAVRISDRAATTTLFTSLTIAGWTQKGDESAKASPVSLKAAAKEARESSAALAAHGASTIDLEHEVDNAQKASETFFDADGDR